MRVSPTCAVISVDGLAGCQKGVGVGVEMSAIEAVEPPLKRVAPPIGAVRSGEEASRGDSLAFLCKFWECGSSGS